jgi:hypothetical protein
MSTSALQRWVVTGVIAAAFSTTVVAQPYHIPQYTGVPLMISNNVVTRQIVEQAHGKLLSSSKSGSGGASMSAKLGVAANASVSGREAITATIVNPPGSVRTPTLLAASYPEANRSEAERLFRDLLSKYPQMMRQLDVPANDMASAVSAFLAGSYMAYRNVDFPDEHFKPLVAQMRQIIGSNPDFAKASNAEKQEMYEQMAILGMFMANTQMALMEKPNPQISANMRQAAKGYLEQFLKTDADRVQITAQGLVLK